MSDRCDCIFNTVCPERRQAIRRDWVKWGMKAEEVFGDLCPWYDTERENQYYEVKPRDAA